MNRYFKFFLIILPILILDLLTKIISQNKDITLIPKVLSITYSTNSGIVFGLFSNNLVVTYLTPLLVIGVIFYYFYKKELNLVGSAFIIAGLSGNLIDRIIHGFVIDWIFVRIYPTYNISLFNIADASLVIGIIISIYYLIKKD